MGMLISDLDASVFSLEMTPTHKPLTESDDASLQINALSSKAEPFTAACAQPPSNLDGEPFFRFEEIQQLQILCWRKMCGLLRGGGGEGGVGGSVRFGGGSWEGGDWGVGRGGGGEWWGRGGGGERGGGRGEKGRGGGVYRWRRGRLGVRGGAEGGGGRGGRGGGEGEVGDQRGGRGGG